MEKEKIVSSLARNMIKYRRAAGMTQAELAQRLNYSDKSISKWERGDGVPDVFVLCDLSEIYGVTVDELLSVDDSPLPEVREEPAAKRGITHRTKVYVTFLASGLVWLVASLVFFIIKVAAPSYERAWLALVAALPFFFVVTTVFAGMWWGRLVQGLSVSGLVWSIALTLQLSFNVENMTYVYIIAAVLEILTILWFMLRGNSNPFDKLFCKMKSLLKPDGE